MARAPNFAISPARHRGRRMKRGLGGSEVTDSVWADDGPGGPLRRETHYDGREMLCFSERPATLAQMFDGLVARYPERPAIVESDHTLSYRALDGLVGRLAAGLGNLQVRRGDRVALFL